jgi:dienelactone hydrolase
MGEVYEAQDLVLQTRVALKTILPSFAKDPSSLERFHREVLLARRISHPSVCRIYELYSTQTPAGEPLHFLTMEFLEGETLTERLRSGGPMRTADLLPILRQISAALDAAHGEGVVHRDFKTSNVMLVVRGADGTRSEERRAVVTDFGIARSLWAEPGAAEKVTGVGLLGTPEYMAPEQVTGAEVGTSADIYALGVVLYEALTGKTPFPGATPLECAVRRVNERPTAPRDLVPRLEGEWNGAILKCLERDPSRRFSTAGDLVRALDQPGASRRHRLLVSAAAIALILAIGSAGTAWRFGLLGSRHDEHWLQSEVIPELHRLADSDQLVAAQLLAMKTDAELPGNASLKRVWHSFAAEVTIRSEPSGARVFIRDYRGADPVWHLLGTTPLSIPYPVDVLGVRLELEGHKTADLTASVGTFQEPIPLDREDAHGDDLLHVAGGRFGPGNLRDDALQLGDFLVDKYEVTNHRYKAFVEAGGYQRREFWRHPFVRNGQTLTWEQAVALFRDRTGRPGPSSWELSNYPPGQDGHPVGGVSWFEAAAFAAFEGRDLPTVYHWRRAAGFYAAARIIPASNFAGKGPAPVGQYRGLSMWGALDMAGNVREWCFNEGTGDLVGRIIAGGGWDDPAYTFLDDRFAQSPWDRSPTNGLRLVTYLVTDPNLERARDPVVRVARDYSKEKPAGDAEFAIYRRMYDYDPRPLHEVIEAKEIETDWVRERVTFDAAYPGGRVIAYLFLPRGSRPPYQTIVYVPGATATELKSVDDERAFPDFILRSGRALILPVYRGTYERRKESDEKPWAPKKTVAYRDAVIQWVQDLRRSLDYLETREDIDRKRVGYFGHSWGGRFGGLIPAVEPRLGVSVLHVAGLRPESSLPEVDPFNFLSRVKIPTLMLNGRYDPSFGGDTFQAMFQGLGTPVGLKRQIIYEVGHSVPRDQLIKETVDWYDHHFGPVDALRAPSGSNVSRTSGP